MTRRGTAARPEGLARRLPAVIALAILAALLAVSASAAPSATDSRQRPFPTYGYDTPVDPSSPWPTFRRDRKNTGRTDIEAREHRGERPWVFQTGKGIFSTPVVDRHGTVYIGSADSFFYAIKRNGKLAWKLKTGEVIDSAAVLGRWDRALRSRTVTFGGGDEHIYRLRTRRGIRRVTDRIAWRYKASVPPRPGQIVNWWEGNVVTGPDGTLYAGNTGGGVYALNPDGTERWIFSTGNSVWSAVAIADDGTLFFNSLDANIYAVNPDGTQKWSFTTVGFNASSPAIGSDGTVYVGSFDSNLYAFDPDSGVPRWRFSTDDHIYSSPALAADEDGNTTAVYIGSTDGSLYKLTPDGQLVWRYDTGDPIRSSPSIGKARGGQSDIVYVGSSNGKLYAINEDGTRRWSYDATPRGTNLEDRNDLNASPVLGRRGIHIAGEHGQVLYVPYEWCLGRGRSDRRCETAAGEELPDEATRVFSVTSGGTTELNGPERAVPAATALTGRLVVRRGGETLDASLQPAGSADGIASASPGIPLRRAGLSGDGHFLHLLPDGFLSPDTEYRLRYQSPWTAEGVPVGNVGVGGTTGATIDDTVTFRTAPATARPPSFHVSRNAVTALNLRRLAVPLPPLMPTVNQIGFDSYDWIVGTQAVGEPDANGERQLLMWVVGARVSSRGRRRTDPRTDFAFPLVGRYKDGSIILSQRDLTLTFSFGDVPIDLIEFRGQFDRGLRMQPGASVFAEVTCLDVPNYGPLLPAIGLCNREGKLFASGAFLAERFWRGRANKRPSGLRVTDVALERPASDRAGAAVARFSLRRGKRYPAGSHVGSILLVDSDTGEPVNLPYRRSTTVEADGAGNLSELRLAIPAGTELPARVRAYVIADVFPLAVREL